MEKKKDIYLLSASDRFNYGDLLFPIVAKHELSLLGDYQFHNVATVKSDLSECGALPTVGYKEILKYSDLSDDSTLIIAGGQVLNANWSRLISFIKPLYYRIYEKYQGDLLEKFAKHFYGKNEVSYPFMPSSPKLLDKMNVVYHAVGGGIPLGKNDKQEVTRAARGASYFSVREEETQKQIKKHFNVNTTLVPDSVAVISDIYPKSSLPKSIDENYACVQFGFHKCRPNLHNILNQLREVHNQQKLTIGLLSIGNCPGHDDMDTVNWILKHADFPVKVLPSNTITEITAALAHADIYIGTSLHGVIVSMSYGNPFVSVNKKIKKVEAYTQTWAPGYLKGSVGFLQIAMMVNKRLSAHIDYSGLIEEHKSRVRASFQRINAVVKN